jgi:hypothetical protein
MRKTSMITAVLSIAFLFFACASSESPPLQVIGTPEEVSTLAGEWVGSYDGGTSGRSGSITFHLADSLEGAHGDVLMTPRQTFTHDREHHQQSMISSSAASVLSIEFVRISGDEVSGCIAPYPDPESPEAMLETRFTGRIEGDWIEGTFVTYSDRGVSPRRGTWRAHRKRSS